MGFLGLPLRNLARRLLRSTLTALGIALAVASFIGLTGLVRGHERAWVQNLLDQGTHAIGVRKGAVKILSTSLDEALGPQLRALPGVLDAAGELVDVVTLDSGRLVVVSGRPLGRATCGGP